MSLMDDFETQGRWLFRWRSYLPMIVVVLAFVAVLAQRGARDDWQPLDAWELACLGTSALGLLIRAIAVGHAPAGTSERTAVQPRAASLVTTGIYSLLRHPLYLGNFFLMAGVVLFARSAWLGIWFALSFWLYYERIMAAEEAFLRRQFGAAFDDWARATPAFLPRIARWTPPALGFSLRNVLRREYNGFVAVFAAMFLLDVAHNLASTGAWQADPAWVGLLGIAMAVWAVLRSLKRYTSWLRAPGH
jgi:protein-S-isoprenylcysteine O-methyltransferase Ste14